MSSLIFHKCCPSLLLMLFLSSQSHAHDICFQPDVNRLQFLCPIDYMKTGGFHLFVTPFKEVLIECDSINNFNINHFPQIYLRKINLLHFRFCPLPTNGFKEVLNQLSTEKVTLIEYEYAFPENQTITKDVLSNLDQLELLKLGKNGFENMPVDVFSNTPNLITLDLKQNNFQTMDANIFKNLTNLQWLDISENRLEKLPSDLFYSLINLEHLYLWSNNLTKIDHNLFKNLTNLKLLDLSANNIQAINKDAFSDLQNLVNVSLSINKLKSIPFKLFKSNSKLQIINLSKNQNFGLQDYLFSNFSNLIEIDLSYCNLKQIPQHLFENSVKLKIINLQNNALTEIGPQVFDNLILEEINLAHNSLQYIENIFTKMHKLKKLLLGHNLITAIEENTFGELFKLEDLNLAHNNLSLIHSKAFYNNEQLRIINLSNNRLSGNNLVLQNLVYLEYLDLSYNSIRRLDDVISLENKPMMEVIDLRHNKIGNISLTSLQSVSEVEIYLDHNKISTVSFENVELISGSFMSIVHLQNNPINCDCNNLDLLRYFHDEISHKVSSMFNIRQDNVFCETPIALKHQTFSNLPLNALVCPFDKNETNGCPEECTCEWRPNDKTVIIDCTKKNLRNFPKIVTLHLKWTDLDKIEVNLSYNLLTSLSQIDYTNVTSLFLSFNKIRSVTFVPKSLKVLTLDNNQLTNINPSVVQDFRIHNFDHLALGFNPWKCDCGNAKLTTFLRQHAKEVDFHYVLCKNSTTRLIDLNEKNLCPDYTIIFSILGITLLFIIASLTTIYYRYQKQIKMFLFSKKLCLSWVCEDDLDRDKIYDAFISYSQLDESFVIDNLVASLESPENGYKLCLHFRDWTPGEMINTQIINSILSSKRTIVVLSQNFLKSVWAKAEFQQAHAEAMAEGRPRVIVIIYGNVEENLGNDLEVYLKTNTYLKWEDSYFWQKLKYALPHKRY